MILILYLTDLLKYVIMMTFLPEGCNENFDPEKHLPAIVHGPDGQNMELRTLEDYKRWLFGMEIVE